MFRWGTPAWKQLNLMSFGSASWFDKVIEMTIPAKVFFQASTKGRKDFFFSFKLGYVISSLGSSVNLLHQRLVPG